MQDFKKLDVWREAQALAVAVHDVTGRAFGADGINLRAQLRRSATSIGANIAEGTAAGSQRQFARYLQMAIGSASETESHLDFAQRARLLPAAAIATLSADTVRVRRRLIALRKRVLETESRAG